MKCGSILWSRSLDKHKHNCWIFIKPQFFLFHICDINPLLQEPLLQLSLLRGMLSSCNSSPTTWFQRTTFPVASLLQRHSMMWSDTKWKIWVCLLSCWVQVPCWITIKLFSGAHSCCFCSLWVRKQRFSSFACSFFFSQGRGARFIGNMQGGDSDEVSDILLLSQYSFLLFCSSFTCSNWEHANFFSVDFVPFLKMALAVCDLPFNLNLSANYLIVTASDHFLIPFDYLLISLIVIHSYLIRPF